MDLTNDNKDQPGPSSVPNDEDKVNQRRDRRNTQKQKRKEENYKKKLESLKNTTSQKLTLITEKTFQKLQDKDADAYQQKDVKNKHFRAAQSKFALDDFLVKTPPEKPKSRHQIPGTIIPSLRKGKVREIPKKKALSRLKRAIIEIRGKRRKLMSKVNSEFEEREEEIQLGTQNEHESDSPKTTLNPTDSITFSRKFRSYCDHANHPEIREHAEKLLSDLFRFQDRAFEKNEIKARAHRRFVVGFKEVERSLNVNKVKLLFIATDLEPNAGKGGLDETVERLKALCKAQSIPYCFPLQRRKIGYLLYKKAPISCVGVLDYSGSEENVKNLMRVVRKQRVPLIRQMQSLELK